MISTAIIVADVILWLTNLIPDSDCIDIDSNLESQSSSSSSTSDEETVREQVYMHSKKSIIILLLYS